LFLGKVKKGTGMFKIFHEKFRAKDYEDGKDAQLTEYNEIIEANPDLRSVIQKGVVSKKLLYHSSNLDFKVSIQSSIGINKPSQIV
jgi:hypothetical protein